MKIRLKPLETLGSFGYDNIVPIIYGIDTVGTCEIIKEDNGRHYGILKIEDSSLLDKFVYYLDSNFYKAVSSVYWFSGLKLRDEDPKSETCKLSDLLI